jgi:hypothetical protein
MDEGLKKQGLEWFERGDHNIATAKMIHDNKGFSEDIVKTSELIQMVREKIS